MAKTYYATRDFNDAGTERSFAAGGELKDVDDGALANYEAAGLATTEKPASKPTTAATPST